MTSRLFKILALLIVTSLIAFQTRADVALVRYDVSWSNLSWQGYMVFIRNGPVPGNIWPNLVDWNFTVDGFVFDPSNTVPWDNGYFAVDENYLLQSDFSTTPFMAPCFSDDGNCDGSESIGIAFSDWLGVSSAQYPSANGSVGISNFGDLSYAGPTLLSASVSVPATPGITLPLMGVALMGVVALARYRRWDSSLARA